MTTWVFWALGALALGLVACEKEPESAWLVVEAPPNPAVDLQRVRIEPAELVQQAARDGSRLAMKLLLKDRTSSLFIDVDGACPLAVPLRELEPSKTTRRSLTPLLDAGKSHADLGYNAAHSFEVKIGCERAKSGRIEWRQVDGPELAELKTSRNGFAVTLRTPPAKSLLPDPLPWGIVPVSTRSSGSALLELKWQDGEQTVIDHVRVSAAPRSRGLPNVAVGSRLLLGGAGWRLVSAPAGARAAVEASSILPDQPGNYRLEDGAGTSLSLRAGRYDDTPLDCGRSDCHRALVRAAAASPMSSILRRGLDLEKRPGYPDCALGCHTTGEPDAFDGGFSHAARELGIAGRELSLTRFDDLPRALRRLGGVGCLACHGPGAIPEPEARWAVLRSDVCAVCHDAPPRYGHVVSWASSRMARSDADSQTRNTPECARCHTTSGFLQSQGALADARPAPEAAGPLGVACAACHAPHEHDGPAGTSHALLRHVRVPAAFEDTALPVESRACIACHAPQSAGALPEASAAAIWLGRGGVNATGVELVGPRPHAKLQKGCLGCHVQGPADLERGTGHAFKAARSACGTCHATGVAMPDSGPALRARAQQLWRRLTKAGPERAALDRPPHAARPKLDPRGPRWLAARNVLLVLEDRGADVHNPAYARVLLDAADELMDQGVGTGVRTR